MSLRNDAIIYRNMQMQAMSNNTPMEQAPTMNDSNTPEPSMDLPICKDFQHVKWYPELNAYMDKMGRKCMLSCDSEVDRDGYPCVNV
jgi:hypothetical protein